MANENKDEDFLDSLLDMGFLDDSEEEKPKEEPEEEKIEEEAEEVPDPIDLMDLLNQEEEKIKSAEEKLEVEIPSENAEEESAGDDMEDLSEFASIFDDSGEEGDSVSDEQLDDIFASEESFAPVSDEELDALAEGKPVKEKKKKKKKRRFKLFGKKKGEEDEAEEDSSNVDAASEISGFDDIMNNGFSDDGTKESQDAGGDSDFGGLENILGGEGVSFDTDDGGFSDGGFSSSESFEEDVVFDIEKEEKPKKKKEKKKKEKKKKEKKPKVKKEKKPKRPKEPDEIIPISKPFLLICVILTATVLAVIILGGEYYNYTKKTNAAVSYYLNQDYDAAYSEIAGLTMHEDDQFFYDKLATIMYVERHYTSYKSLYKMKNYEQALHTLLRGIKMYDKYKYQAKDYDCEEDLTAVLAWIDAALLEKYGLTENEARELNNIDNRFTYARKVYEISDVAKAREEAAEQAAREEEKAKKEAEEASKKNAE